MTTHADTGAVALALGGIALEATAWALRVVLVPVLAMALTLAGYRPSSKPQRQEQGRHQPAVSQQAPEAPARDAAPQPQPKATKPRKRASRAGISQPCASRAKTTRTKTTTTKTAAVAA